MIRALLSSALLGLSAIATAEPLVPAFARSQDPSIESGRLLFHEIGCTNCHQGGAEGVPERTGPVITQLSGRLDPDWVRGFLTDPQAHRPGSSMPDLLNDEEAEAVLHHLYSLPAWKRPKPPRHLNAERGSALFHEIGCVACHEPTPDHLPPNGIPDPSLATYPSVAFPDLAAKYDLTSLTSFLTDPLKHRPDGRMPKFDIDKNDIPNLAAHLLDNQDSNGKIAPKVKTLAVDAALSAEGAKIVAEKNCVACHEVPNQKKTKLRPIHDHKAGCLGNDPAIDFQLSARQKESLTAFLSATPKKLTPADLTHHTVEALNCIACHQRDEQGGPDSYRDSYFTGNAAMGSAGLLPPPLTGIGHKLQPDWLREVLQGEHRLRPYLHTRMPIYGKATDHLPELFSAADQPKGPRPPLPKGDTTIGQQLLGTADGIGCITCHSWGDRPSLGVPSLKISNLAQRLDPGWFRSYLLDPTSYRPGTLMPAFWPEGKSPKPHLLGGDADAQIASIYAFAAAGKDEPAGYPATNTGAFEIIPQNEPVVQRAWLEKGGTHALVIGFPEGIHYAYDTLQCRPRLAWKGRFFDAYQTWFSRAQPFEKPLGEEVVAWPAELPRQEKWKYRGYRLGAEDRVPTLLLSIDGEPVEERITPIENGLRRTLRWTSGNGPEFSVSPPEGTKPETQWDPKTATLTIQYRW